VVSGAYANKNVIVIQVEALQAMAYGAYYGGEEITPNLNNMADDSWVCTNTHSQSGVGNTSDSEFTLNTSLLQPPGKAAVLEYVDREIPSIPRLLNDAGYRTVTMHGNDVAFWNRKELYASLGFQQYYDRTDIGSADQMYRGASDEQFFIAAQRLLTNDLGRGKPLYANLITMSSHAPYTHVPYDRRPIQVPESLHGSNVANWVGAISYADMALGQFLDWLKETGLYDESIVIVYGDHKAIKELKLEGPDKQIVEGLLGHPYSVVDRQKVPLLIHLPGQTEGGVINTTTGITDIAPTMADLLGVDMSETPHLGRSVFSKPADPLVITRGHFPAGSFLNDRVAFMPELSFDDGTALRLADGGEVKTTAKEKSDFERALVLSRLSDEWIRSLPVRPDAGDVRDAVLPKSIKLDPGE
jgi:phosphoglycerol transferase MdoB-like AlkP superfamily enzyme